MSGPLVHRRLSEAQLAARWRELLDQPGLPHMFELDQYGGLIEMNPPKTPHQRIVRAFQQQIEEQAGGEALPGLGVLTSIGVRIPDVVWQDRWANEDPASPAPTICVEVLSPDNTRREIDEKTTAYLAAGAREVIIVETNGRIRFFGAEGERLASALGLALTLPAGTYPL
ncbi:MAG: Uma2 family endonuclease [Burkholderiales bacterium]|nr:Uma2 family endonuclease [Burkholderiales bacterium]